MSLTGKAGQVGGGEVEDLPESRDEAGGGGTEADEEEVAEVEVQGRLREPLQIRRAGFLVSGAVGLERFGVSLDREPGERLGVSGVAVGLGDHERDPGILRQGLGVLRQPADMDVESGQIRVRVEQD